MAVTVTGPHRERVPGAVLRLARAAWVESAQACGLALTGGGAARRAPPRGASASWSCTRSKPVPPTSWSGWAARAPTTAEPACSARWARPPTVRSTRVRPVWRASPRSTSGPRGPASTGVALTCASDVDSPLTGLFGATKTFGPQKGIAEDRLPGLDGCARGASPPRPTGVRSLEQGAGAAGGLGFALLLLGARATPGLRRRRRGGRPRRRGPARADLVLTGEGAFDFSSRSGKVPYGVAAVAADGAPALRRPGGAGAGRLPRDARARRRVGVLPGRPGGGGARARRPGGAASRSSPSASPAPGRTDRGRLREPLSGHPAE